MVLAKAEVIENLDQAIKLGKEIERVESALKAMKAELKAFVDVDGPVDTCDVIWDYTISASWQFDENAKKVRNAGKNEKRYTIRSPEDAASYIMADMVSLTQEHFVVLYLNVKNEVLHKKNIFIGSLNSSIVLPREVYKEAVKHSAVSIICFHYHPSAPSCLYHLLFSVRFPRIV